MNALLSPNFLPGVSFRGYLHPLRIFRIKEPSAALHEKQDMSMRRLFTALLPIFLVFLPAINPELLASEEPNRSAAEIDWQPGTETNTSGTVHFCQGRYVEPKFGNQGTKLTNAAADEALVVEGKSKTLIGNVVVTQANQEVRSPRILQNDITEVSEIDGPLQIRQPGLLLTGEHATVNLFEGTGMIDQSTFLLHQSRLRGQAARLVNEKTGNLLLDDATLTRCDPDSNAWVMNSKDIELSRETGIGIAHDVTIRVRDVPALYLPYLRFPIDDRRQSGFLLPNIGHDSDGGLDINIPYYFNLAPNYDATYQLRSLWKRGLIHDGQFRFLSERSTNEINLAYLREDDTYDDRLVHDQTSSGTNTSMVPVPEFKKQDRWLLNLRHEGGSESRWKTSLNYNSVSDKDYLHDIGGEVRSPREQYTGRVGSNYSNRRTNALDRIGQVQYRGEVLSAELLLRGYQNLNALGREQYERLPTVRTDWFYRYGPVNISLDLEYSNFDKDNSDLTGALATVGQRGVTDLDISLPLRSVWGFVEPSIGVIHRRYNLDDTPANVRTKPEETTPRFSIDAGLYFDKYFKWQETAIQQTLEPRVFFLYVEHDEQDDLPQFDVTPATSSYSSIFRTNRFNGYDRIADTRQIGLGLTTRYLSESTAAEFFSASIGQIYYLDDRDVLFRPRPGEDPTANESALFTRARLSLSNGLSMYGSFEWEPRENRSNRGTISLKYRDGPQKILNLNYIYTNPMVRTPSLYQKSEESDINFIWLLAKKWSLIGRWNFGWDEDQTIESFLGLEYNDCCWKSRFLVRRYIKDPRTVTRLVDDPASPGGFIPVSEVNMPAEVGIFFEFQLKGLATLGKRLDSLLEDAIPGYKQRENKIGL